MPGKPKVTDPTTERRVAAILAVDIDDYLRLTREDDISVHRRVSRELSTLRDAIRKAYGSVFSFANDGVMAEFTSATEAFQCALRIQADVAGLAGEAGRAGEGVEPICFRMGVAAGEILVGGRHLAGTAINLAGGLARSAPAGGIALTAELHDQIRHVVPVPVTPLGQPALRGITQPVTVVGIAAETCLAWSGQPAPRSSPRPRPEARATLAVVPFRTDHRHEAFANAATDDVIRSFGGLATWLAVSRTAGAVVRTPIDLGRLRQTSDARYILHGAVETERSMLRLAVELNEADTGRVLWSDRFDHLIREPAALREDAACRIARAIPPLLLQRELDRSTLVTSAELTAYDLALRAFAAVMQPESGSLRFADDLLLEAGPHVTAYFVRVWWHLMAISQGYATDLSAEADALADTAGRMDRDDPAAMALRAYLQSVLHRDHGLASVMLDRVIDTSPVCALAWTLKSLTLCCLDEAQSAVFHAEQAQLMPVLGPERAWRDHVTALAYYISGRYDDAVRWARVSAMQHHGLAANARVLAASLAVLGQLDEAQQAARQVLIIDPGFRISTWRQRSLLPEVHRDVLGQRLRLAGLPG
jgi:adenylate cyclase